MSRVRTTPRWLRLPSMLLVAALALHMLICFRLALKTSIIKDEPLTIEAIRVFQRPTFDFVNPRNRIWWTGNWQMFTQLDVGQTAIRGYAQYEPDGDWVRLPLQRLFPSTWESGPRYQRSSFFKSRGKMSVFANATCGRVEAANALNPDSTFQGRPLKVKYKRLTWRKKLGRIDKMAPEKHKARTIFEWDCSRTVNLPKGRVL